MRFPPALAALVLLLAGSLPLPARAAAPCVGLKGPIGVVCYRSADRFEWEAASQLRGSPGYLVNFDDFVEDASFDNTSTGGIVDAGRLRLQTAGPGSCIPFKQNICGFNLVRTTSIASAPSIDGTAFAHVYVNRGEDTREATELHLSFDEPQTAFGALFQSEANGEALRVVVAPGRPEETSFDLRSGGGSFFHFFGFLTHPAREFTEIHLVSRSLTPGTSGEIFGMDNVGNVVCLDGIDNDGDGLTDGFEDPGCLVLGDLSEEEDCGDGFDNDADGLTDAADDGCRESVDLSEEIDCADGIDNDLDGFVDFDADPEQGDTGCDSAEDDDERAPGLPCNDGVDNDGDGLTDFGEDSACAGADSPSEVAGQACDNGEDDDGDGLTDFSGAFGAPDPGCLFLGDDSEQVDCDNGIDDDGDGRIDRFGLDGVPDLEDGESDGLDDPGCHSFLDGSELRDCQNGVDDDGDGFTDFPEDPGCGRRDDGNEVAGCEDGVDNDGDGQIDLADPGCSGAEDLSEVPDCEDGFDNDRDGFRDFSGADGFHRDDPGAPLGAGADDDRGCSGRSDASERSPDLVCDNGLDDDGDGLIDIPADRGCEQRLDDDERFGGAAFGVICDNGLDDDGDGTSDFGGPDADPGCSGPFDVAETSVCSDGIDNDGDGFTDFQGADGFQGDDPDAPEGAGSDDDRGCEDEGDDDERPDCGDDVDSDGDNVCDQVDTCLTLFNPDQLDTNRDGIGNPCDYDYDDDGIVGGPDFSRMAFALETVSGDPDYDPDVDSDGDGVIGAFDFNRFRANFGLAPGPSFADCGAAGCLDE